MAREIRRMSPVLQQFGSQLWMLLFLLHAFAINGYKSPSCHEVKTAFQLRQIGPLKWVPDVPTTESDMKICLQKGLTCCTKKMEDSYQGAVQREILQTIQSFSFELKYVIVGHNTALQEAFEALIRIAANHTDSLFETVYRNMAQDVTETVKELFTDISLYILGSDVTVEGAITRFLDSLFPVVYSRVINPGIARLSEEYIECLRMTRQDVNPFGQYSKQLVTELSKSLQASRLLSMALNLGVEVINTTEHVTFTKECSKALVRMQYCSHCHGLTLIRPCVGYCLNVMRGCLASVAELDAHWREYILMLEELTNNMAGSHDLELALLGIRSTVNEAILNAQLNGPQLTSTVDKVCGQPEIKEVSPSPENMIAAEDPVHVTKPPMTGKAASLTQKKRELMNYMRGYKTFFASLAERLCDGDLVVRDSSTCWNGEDVVESYTRRVVGNGLKAQADNPEMRVRGWDPTITQINEKLQQSNQMLEGKKKAKPEKWTNTEVGSGDGLLDMETSGDCDDEDGCQGSGSHGIDKNRPIYETTGNEIYTEGKGTQGTSVKKTDTVSVTTTTKPPPEKGSRGTAVRQLTNCWALILTTIALLTHWFL
ncbi:glypican-5 isoform X2 [Protopterus annectens]|uniref:glypican-5 isoform X2 n=1 Tax=Protopterus annectens TaxID=7888 RepID=UPI001CF93E0C|nr:glypican-5 isoform X2 [Protopterus annectens]